MSTLKGTLVIAGMFAAVGLGCSHSEEAKKTPMPPPSATEVTTPPATEPISPTAPEPGMPGTEMGTGGAGQSTGGFPSSTPSTTTPRQSSTGVSTQNHGTNIPSEPSSEQGIPNTVTSPQEGTGGAGMEVKDPEACNRNQIGSPNSSDVICDPMPPSSSSTSGDVGTTGIPDQNSGMGGSGLDQGTMTDEQKEKEKKAREQQMDTVP